MRAMKNYNFISLNGNGNAFKTVYLKVCKSDFQVSHKVNKG